MFNKKYSKLASIVLTGLLAFGLTSCGGGNAGGAEKPENGGTGAEVAGEQETLEVWAWDVCYYFFEDIKDDFEAANPGIKLDIKEMGTTQVFDSLSVGLQTDSGLPDIVMLEGEQMAKFGLKFPGKLTELSDIVNPEDFMPVKISEVTVNGEILGVPWDSAPAALFYRTDLFEEAGIKAEDIVTWDDFIVAGKTMLDKTGVKMMPLSASRHDIFFRMLMNQNGGFYFDIDGNSDINSEAAKVALKKTKEIYDAGITHDYGGWDEYIISMKDDLVATVPEAVWIAGSFKEEAPDTKGKWSVMPFPIIDENSTGVATNGGSVICIPTATKSPEAAKLFAEFSMMNIDSQIKGFAEYGLFPSYKPVFESDKFDPKDEFFNNEDIYTMFAELGNKIPEFNYTENFDEAVDFSKNMHAGVMIGGDDSEKSLNELQETFINRFGK